MRARADRGGHAQPMSNDDNEGIADPPPAYAGHDARRGKKGEARLPPALAVIVAIALYALLPQSLLVGPRLLIPALEVVLLIVVVSSNPWRLNRQTRITLIASLALAAVIVAANLVALGLLIHALVTAETKQAGELLLAALQVWATNVIAFGRKSTSMSAQDTMLAPQPRPLPREPDLSSTTSDKRQANNRIRVTSIAIKTTRVRMLGEVMGKHHAYTAHPTDQ